MNYNGVSYSNRGDREQNEDTAVFTVISGKPAAIIADGMGGCEHGEIASQYAVSEIIHSIRNAEMSKDDLLQTIIQVNEFLFYQRQRAGSMMTTLAMLWFDPEARKGLAVNVGDSRLYQFRDGRIIFQSMDHSIAQLAVMTGEISADEIRNHPYRNRLIRALGAEATVSVDCMELCVQPGDAFLLCSDGLWNLVDEGRMKALLQESANSAEWLDRLRQEVEKSDALHKDNHSAVAVIATEKTIQ